MNHQQKSTTKLRAINTGSDSDVGQARRRLYKNAFKRVFDALTQGYALEAIALIESMIADRLESRTAAIHGHMPEKREFSTLVKLAQPLAGKKSNEPDEAKQIFRQVEKWSARRKTALHEMVKLAEGSSADWHARYEIARQDAAEGIAILRKVDNVVAKLNRTSKGSPPQKKQMP